MGKKLALAVLLTVVMAVPAFASVQNVKVGGSLKTTSVIREDISTNATRDRMNEVFAQTHLDVAADLTDNVSTKIGLLQERVWGNSSDGTPATEQASIGNVELETAYVTMKEFLYSPLTMSIGRQPLEYGNQLIIGSSGNAGSVGAVSDLSDKGNFDAIKAVLSYDPLTIDLFASRIDNTNTVTAAVETNRDDVNLYGINANYKIGDKMSTVVEGYIFAKVNASAYAARNQKLNTYVPGLRVSMNPIEGINVQLEGAYQTGQAYDGITDSNERRNAYAFQGIMNYALPVLKDMTPVLGAAYKYLSGAKDPVAGTGEDLKVGKAWDAMYADQDNDTIYDAKSLANSNAQIATLSVEVTPLKDLTTKLSWNGVWLAQKAAYSNTVSSSKYMGSEVDLDLTYAYTEDVKFGVSAGHFMTGKNAVVDQGNKSATQLLSSVSVAF